MTQENSVRTDRSRYLDISDEPDIALPPLPTVTQTTQNLTLHQSIQNMKHLLIDLEKRVSYSLAKCKHPKDGLSQDESAALYLYSLQWPKGQHSHYSVFNRALRHEDRTRLIPFHDYYNLFMAALKTLPSIQDRVWRGVNGDISKQYLQGTIHIWWGASSCSDEVMVTDTFLDQTAPRTLFSIKCFNGKTIKNHSEYPNESETILMPGTYIKVTSQSNPAGNFHIVQCEEIEPVSADEVAKSHAIAGATVKSPISGALSTMKSVLYLIWLDPNVSKSQDNLKTQEKLRELFNDDFQTYEKADECEASIKQKKNDSIILIVGGQVGRQIVPKIHNLAQLTVFVVYCMDKEGNEKWAKSYEKNRAVVVRSNDLVKEVSKEKNTYLASSAAAAIPQQAQEPKSALKTPISGYEKKPLVSLEEAVKPLYDLIPDIQRQAHIATHNTTEPNEGLTPDESASIMIYTMEWEHPEFSLYSVLNRLLRLEDRDSIKPYILYLKLVLTALGKLPSYQGTVWRGVRMDLSKQYVRGDRGVWVSFTTTTLNADILQHELFLGTTGERTLFSIRCRNGKQIRHHSIYPQEEEILLMPGFYYEVISVLQTSHDMHLISLKEVDGPF